MAMNSVVKMILITTCALSLSPSCTLAQKNFSNSFKISSSYFYINNSHLPYRPYAQIGVSFERKIYKSWHIGCGYYTWDILNMFDPAHDKIVGVPDARFEVGRLQTRINYKMADLYGFYKWQVGKKHAINGGLGASYCWGENSYLKWFYVNPEPPSDIIGEYYLKNEHYWGLIPQISYDFLFIKDRFNIGADLRGRYYVNRSPAQYDFGIHVGVNF